MRLFEVPGPVVALAFALTLLGGCASPGDESAAAQRAMDAAVPPGEPQRCISTRNIRNVEILNDATLLFRMRNADVWRNRLPNRCPGLRAGDTLMYEVRTGQLCNLDTVTALDNAGFGFMPGATCGLGKFDYLTEEQANTLKQMARERR